MNRRELLLRLGVLGGALGTGGFRSGVAFGAPGRTKSLVVLFLRGGVDGLSMVPPLFDEAYAPLRPTTRILPPGSPANDAALPLDGRFGLHPKLKALQPWFEQKRLAFFQAVGQTRATRSHFDAQDFLESGAAGQKANSGVLNRAAQVLGATEPLATVALQSTLPYSLWGDAQAAAFPSLKVLRVGGAASSTVASRFEDLYASAVDAALKKTAASAFDVMGTLEKTDAFEAPPKNGATYPTSPLAQRLQDIARLVHADVGLRIAATETGGFDTHVVQGAGAGTLAARFEDLGNSLAAFATDLGDRLDDVCLLTLTEFGRTAKENGNRGTDHGTASAMLALGGRVAGGRVVTDWPGLKKEQLHEQRDLKVTTDVRELLCEALESHLAVPRAESLFFGLDRSATRRLFPT